MGAGEQRQVSTNAAGRFTINTPALATYTFTSSGRDSCVDDVTNTAVAFPYMLVLPPLTNATVTAISLLAVPARADPVMQAKYGSMAEVVPADLWTDVYGMFGYAADAKVGGGTGCPDTS